jgi:hypothetical protein
MKIKLKSLNNAGFVHHIIVPIVTVVAIGAIGTYVIAKSHAATTFGSRVYTTCTIIVNHTQRNDVSYPVSIKVETTSKESFQSKFDVSFRIGLKKKPHGDSAGVNSPTKHYAGKVTPQKPFIVSYTERKSSDIALVDTMVKSVGATPGHAFACSTVVTFQ